MAEDLIQVNSKSIFVGGNLSCEYIHHAGVICVLGKLETNSDIIADSIRDG